MNIKSISKPAMMVATATMVASAVGIYVYKEEHRQPLLEVYVFSLKDGQSIFIRTPEDRRILIDGGGGSEVIRLISAKLPFYSRRIDDLIVTKPTGKKVGGLISIINRYGVNKVYLPAITLESLVLDAAEDTVYAEFLKTISVHKIPVRELSAGGSIESQNDGLVPKTIADRTLSTRLKSHVLFPVSPKDFSYSKASGPSLVLELKHGSNSILVLGDVSKKIQKYVASYSFSDGLSLSHSTIESDFTVNEDVSIVAHDAISKREESEPLRGDEVQGAMPSDPHRVLVVSNTGNASNLSSELIQSYMPDAFIYSKKISYTKPKTPAGKKIAVDPVGDLSSEVKFNTKESGITKIVSDGRSLTISSDR